MGEPTLKPVDRLSVWDISHYWHDANPQTSSPSKLPLEVQKTLRALALKASKSLYLRCGKGFIYKSLTDPENELPLSYIRRLYKREFKYVIEGRKYKKSFLSSLNMSRVGVLVWCRENKFKPPSFWFADDDPLLAKPLQELGRKFTPDEIEQYGLILLLNEESKPAGEHIRTSSDSDLSQDRPDFPEKTSFIKEAISEINKANAKARFAPAEKLKLEFKEYYEANGYKNKSRAARDYFDSLTPEQRKIIVPSYFEREHKSFYRLAVRNLLRVFKATN
jgi:hypothetical protein